MAAVVKIGQSNKQKDFFLLVMKKTPKNPSPKWKMLFWGWIFN